MADAMAARLNFKEWAEPAPDEDEDFRKDAMGFKTRNYFRLTRMMLRGGTMRCGEES